MTNDKTKEQFEQDSFKDVQMSLSVSPKFYGAHKTRNFVATEQKKCERPVGLAVKKRPLATVDAEDRVSVYGFCLL